ncbi:MAG: DUF4124 domain-containing protein, partial [Candidatus Methylumidiphilus sp.]
GLTKAKKSNGGAGVRQASLANPSQHKDGMYCWAGSAALFGLILLSAVLSVFTRDSGAGTFRWVDDQGVVHYTDQVPPEQSKRPHAKLNTNAETIELVEGQKSPEQLEQIKRLKQLRMDQQRVLAMQKDSDLSLKRTYRSVEEMQMALQNKINTMDSTIKIADSNRQHQEENLRNQVKRAAEMELSGSAVSKNLRDSIDSTRRQIASYQEKIRLLERSKNEIILAFQKDLERFKSLENQNLHPEYGSSEWRGQISSADVGILSIVTCKPSICPMAWKLAKDYVKSKSNKPLLTETESIIQTVGSHEEKDLALLVVRIPGRTSDTIFLDTSCHTSSLGDEFCAGPIVKEIRSGFAGYIQNGLNIQPH